MFWNKGENSHLIFFFHVPTNVQLELAELQDLLSSQVKFPIRLNPPKSASTAIFCLVSVLYTPLSSGERKNRSVFYFFFYLETLHFCSTKAKRDQSKSPVESWKIFLVSEYITGISSFVIVALDVKISKKMVGYLNDAKRPRKKKTENSFRNILLVTLVFSVYLYM